MEHISENTLARANIINESERLFVSLWAELFNSDTIDTYRVRVMNAHNIIQELLDVIEQRIHENVDIRNIQFGCDEALRIISQDPICNEVFPNETRYVKSWLAKAKNELKTINEFRALSARLLILKTELDKNYLDCVLSALEQSIFETHTNERTTILTSCLATELVANGFSMSYLYSRKQMFLDIERGETFRARWNYFRNGIRNNQRVFDVFLKFTGPSDWSRVRHFLNVTIQSTLEVGLDNPRISEFSAMPGTFIAKISDIKAADPTSAAISAAIDFSTFLDLVNYEYRRLDKRLITPKGLVVENLSENCFVTELNLQTRGFQSKGNIERLLRLLGRWERVQQQETSMLDVSSRERIQNSLRYFRMGLETTVLESRYLHFWIALEFLLKTGSHESIISPIIQFVPKSLALHLFKKLLRDFSANLVRLRVDRDILLGLGIRIDHEKPNVYDLLGVLTDEVRAQGLVDALYNPLLKHRALELSSIMTDGAIAHRRMIQHYEDLKWHLQRMYRIRNRIVHSAAIDFNLLQIESNLSYYFTTLFNNILYLADHSTSKTSIEQLMLKQEAMFDFVLDNLRTGRPQSRVLLPSLVDD